MLLLAERKRLIRGIFKRIGVKKHTIFERMCCGKDLENKIFESGSMWSHDLR